MKLYRFLSRIGFLKKYNAKFMFIAFLGIHIPLIGIIVSLILTSGSSVNKLSVFVLALVLTLLATAITLFIPNALVLPLKKTQHALSGYLMHQSPPNLPKDFNDELGRLMLDINQLTAGLDTCMTEKQEMTLAVTSIQAAATELLALIQQVQHEQDPVCWQNKSGIWKQA